MKNQKDPSEFLGKGWASRLAHEFKEPYMDGLREFLRQEYASKVQVFPPKENIFRALQMVDFEEVRVVILGQDPYHGDGQANGLAFAVHEGTPLPPSLNNIFKEIRSDCGANPSNPGLEGWARQGVFLLNSVLTVRAHQAFSHRNKGWETFTDRVVVELNQHSERIVFLLWGAAAQAKGKLVTNQNHVILQAPHPSPLSAHRGFTGCKHFSKANACLGGAHRAAIDWENS